MLKTELIILICLIIVSWSAAQDSLSVLKITSDPQGAQIYLDDILSGSTPNIITRINLGNHTLKITRVGYEDWITNLNIESIDTNSVHAILNPLRGQIQVNCDVKNAYIYIDGKLTGQTPKLIKEIEYGKHYIEIRQQRYYPRDYEYNAFRDTLLIEDHTVKIIDATLRSSWISVKVNPVNSTIKIDDDLFYSNSVDGEKVRFGSHKIRLSSEGYKNKTVKVYLKPNQHYEYEYDLIPLRYKSILYRSFIFPGYGHYYADKTYRGYLYALLELSAIGTAIYSDIRMSDASDSYKKKYNLYLDETDETETLRLHNIVQKKFDEFQDYKQFRNIMIGSAIAIWLVNIYDAHLLGKKFEKKNSTISHLLNKTNLSINSCNEYNSIGLTFKL